MITIKKNFTLLEMSVVLLIIVSLASFLVSQGLPIVQKSTERNLDQKMQLVQEAIAGSPSIRDLDGSIIPNGYVNDIGAFPDPSINSLEYSFQQLLEQLSQPNYINHDLAIVGKMYAGWNGPYLTEAGYSRLTSIIKLELVDADSDGNDDIRIFANGYSELERYIYWNDHFRKRNITIAGLPSTFTAKVTIDYKLDGVIQSYEQDVTGSAETTVDLPKGICAFYAEFLEGEVIHTVVATQVDPLPNPTTPGDKVRVASSGTTNSFIGKENKIMVWDGSTYVDPPTEPLSNDTLYDESDENYYVYNSVDEIWELANVKGKKTPRVIKTIKTDILLELE